MQPLELAAQLRQVLLVDQLLDQLVLRHLLAADQILDHLLPAQQLLHLAQVLLQVLGFEPLVGRGHAQGICAEPMRARMVSTRPAM